MFEDLSVTISVAVALAAIISPIFVALINNRHNRKIRQLELKHDISIKKLALLYEDKKNAFSNFLLNAGKVCTDEELHDVEQEFYGYAQLASLYASVENRQLISQFTNEIFQYINTGIPTDKYDYFLKMLFDISDALSKELAELNIEICNNKNRK